MRSIKRREFTRLGLMSGLGLISANYSWATGSGPDKARVAVIGGGFGGATAAKYLKLLAPGLDVTLIEPNATFLTCPFSNFVVSGHKPLDSLKQGYRTFEQNRDIRIVHAMAKRVDSDKKRVLLEDGSTVPFDRAIVSPGVDFRWESIPGLSPAIAEKMPHAWKAGAQTARLAKMITEMPDDGTMIICPPKNPYRCPPGPYERASLLAHRFMQSKPEARIVILDQKEKFSKQGLFMPAWEGLYGEMIEWRAASAGGKIVEIPDGGSSVETEFGLEEADVINFIPDQKAGALADQSGLTDKTGWCPINQQTFESTLAAGIHVIGDSAIAGRQPKSAFSANSQGKAAALAVVSLLSGREVPEPILGNTCYSHIAPDYAVSVSNIYKLYDGKIEPVPDSGGTSPKDADRAFRKAEANFARGWYESVTSDTFS